METDVRFRGVRLFWNMAAVVALLGACAGTVHAQPSPSSSAESAISEARSAVEGYFSAADSGDPQAVRNAFWPEGRISGSLNGRIVSWTAEDFATRNFKGKPASNADVTRTIEWIDVSGTGAVARVKVVISGNKEYWDYFTLFKAGGVWKIGVKAFANPE